MVKFSSVICFLLMFSISVFAGPGKDMPCFDKLWKDSSDILKDSTGKTWKETGTINMTLRSSITHVENELLQKKFQKKNMTEQEKHSKKSYISLWSNRNTGVQIIIMLTEKDLDETCFSWGVIRHGK